MWRHHPELLFELTFIDLLSAESSNFSLSAIDSQRLRNRNQISEGLPCFSDRSRARCCRSLVTSPLQLLQMTSVTSLPFGLNSSSSVNAFIMTSPRPLDRIFRGVFCAFHRRCRIIALTFVADCEPGTIGSDKFCNANLAGSRPV